MEASRWRDGEVIAAVIASSFAKSEAAAEAAVSEIKLDDSAITSQTRVCQWENTAENTHKCLPRGQKEST